MLLKTERGKTLCVLIAAQTVSLAAGLFIHHRFVLSAMQDAGREDAWVQLTERAEVVQRQIEQVGDTPNSILALHDPMQPSFSEADRSWAEWHVTVVDASWRILAGPQASSPGAAWSWQPAPPSEAISEPSDRTPNDGVTRGFVDTPSGQHLAVAHRHPSHDGYVVVHYPMDHVTASPRQVARPMFYAALITFIWTAGVLNTVVFMVVSQLCDQFTRRRVESENAALRRTESLSRMRDAIIFGLAKLTESRDPDTGFHLERISLFSSRLALALRRNAKYRSTLTPEFIRLIEISSTLHDIGKVGVEDSVLLKPGRLSNEERARMQRHAIIGGKCIQDIEQRLGSSNFLQMARQIAFWHHERWDGAGYPNGLSGEEIPLAARIVAVADVYEALATRRVYKNPLPHEQCVEYIREQSGQHFDPDVVDAFLEIHHQFHDICRRYNERRDVTENFTALGDTADVSPSQLSPSAVLSPWNPAFEPLETSPPAGEPIAVIRN